jgi:hypothetical protein
LQAQHNANIVINIIKYFLFIDNLFDSNQMIIYANSSLQIANNA